MGGNSSKEISSVPKIKKLQRRGSSLDQFSTWNTTLCKSPTDCQLSSNNNLEETFTVEVESGSCSHGLVKLKFFFRDFEKWHGTKVTANSSGSSSTTSRQYGTRGISLWAILEAENEFDDDQYFIISIKISKTVNEEGSEQVVLINDDTTFHSQLFIEPRESHSNKRKVLIQDQFLTLAILRRKAVNGLEDEMLMYGSANKIELQVNFAVKVMYSGSIAGYDDNRDGERILRGNSKNIEGTTSLVRDLRKLYSSDNNNMLSDVTLKSKDGMAFRVHKVILAARSPYFRRWIQWSPTAFAKEKPVVLDTVTGKALMTTLHWMYTGELLEDVGNFVNELVEAAVKFEMADLLKILEKRRLTHDDGSNRSGRKVARLIGKVDGVRKIKRAVLAWFPLLRYRFGHRPIGIIASIINAVYGIYELF